MAQDGERLITEEAIEVTDQQPAQPSSPAGSTSSKEEKNAREKLKKTSIAGLKQHINDAESIPTDESSAQLESSDPNVAAEISNGARGRPAKKRSFEDLAKDDAAVDAADNSAQPPEPKSGHHKRMRSRDVAAGDNIQTYSKIDGDKTETVHEETDMDAQISPGGPGVLVNAPSQEEMDQDEAANASSLPTKSESEPISKPDPLETQPATAQSSQKMPQSSGFANTSTASPFSRAKSPPVESITNEPTKTTSPSAFASSGMSAFASTEKSPFGVATSSKSPGGFGGGGPISGFGSSKGGFGSSSTFGSTTTSGFGGGGGFGSGTGFGNKFGAPKPFGTSAAFGTGGPGSGGFGTGKPFTTTTEKDEQEDGGAENDENEDAASIVKDDGVQDPRFHEQEVDTGEKGEEVHFSSRARLYFFSRDGGWKERGTGVFKINIRVTEELGEERTEVDVEAQSESNGKRRARLLMRADATHRVILNSPVFKGMKFGAPDGTEPTGKIMHIQSLEESKPVPLQIRIGKEETLKELYHRLRELEQEA